METRRSFLKSSITGLIVSSIGSLLGCTDDDRTGIKAHDRSYNKKIPLLPPDNNGLMLPSGFVSRIIARSGVQPYINSSYVWHDAPDGGATFSTHDGGWIYVSNAEVDNNLGGTGEIGRAHV